MITPRKKFHPLRLASLLACGAGAPLAATTIRAPADFLGLSFEELGAIKVTSVSKKLESLFQTPAAVSVITADDIRRSGALTLPDALRMAPGTNVAQVDAAQWAVSVRGFNDTLAQKLLVLIDGRSVYTPLFSGTFWQAQDVLLEDTQRIEVVRGPGGTVWGANAVNGVINIVSKPARETQGTLVTGGAGTERPVLASVRHGAAVGEHAFVRIYGKHDQADSSQLVRGGRAHDGWEKTQGGFRFDWEPTSANRLTVQGDLFKFQLDQVVPHIVLPVFRVPPPATGYTFPLQSEWDQRGANLLGRWTHQASPESDFSVQAYYDRSNFDASLARETRHTSDVDLRQRISPLTNHEIVWGGGYRLSRSQFTGSTIVSLMHPEHTDRIFNAFVQDEIKVIPGRLHWTLGAKLEHNGYTGREFQPGTRVAWLPADTQTVWLSVARAVRTPSQAEREATFNIAVLPPALPASPLPTLLTATGVGDFKSETLIAYEIGYRVQPHRRLTVELAAYLNDYDRLRSSTEGISMANVPNYVQVRSVFGNGGHGATYGGEFAASWQVTAAWRLHGHFNLHRAELKQPPDALTGLPRPVPVTTPRKEASLRSIWALGRNLDFDAALRAVDRVASAGAALPLEPLGGSAIPGYATADVRLAWRPAPHVELTLIGKNLAGSHREFNPSFTSYQFVEIGRSLLGKAAWKF